MEQVKAKVSVNTDRRFAQSAVARKRRAKANTVVRLLIQLIFFVSMPGAFMAGFSGVKDIFRHVSDGSALELNGFVMAMLGLCGFTIIFGRFFCGYACSFGALGDWIYAVSSFIRKRILHIKKIKKPHENIIAAGQKIKYIILAVVITACALGYYDRFNVYNWNPWSVFSFFTALNFTLNGYVAGGIILLLIIVGMALKERFFCQFLCPMGAVFALMPQFPFSQLSRDEQSCSPKCNACRNKCPVNIKLETDGFRNGECISCEKCADICPKSNITRIDRRMLRFEVIPVLIKAGLLYGLGAYLGLCRFI